MSSFNVNSAVGFLVEQWNHFLGVPEVSVEEMSVVVPAFLIAMAMIRFCAYKYVFNPLSSKYVPREESAKARKKESWITRRRKFVESCWKLMYYLSAWIFTVYTCTFHNTQWKSDAKDSQWFWDADSYFGALEEQEYPVDLKLIYVIQLAYYVYSLLILILPVGWIASEVDRSDAAAMGVHHLLTVVLIGFSYFSGYVRVGIIILLVHDIADIFMETAKLLNYMQYQKLCDSVFILFTFIWFYSRLYIYPLYPIAAASAQSHLPYIQSLLVPALYGLLVLHVYWSLLILRMVYRFVVLREVEGDIRETDHEGKKSR